MECGKTNDHDLWVGRQVGGTYDGSPLFLCKVCGAYASAQCKALKRPCTRSWGGRRNGFVRFMGGRHPCLKNVLIEGQRCISAADVATGVRSCARHNIYWARSSEGGIKRPSSRKVGGHMAGQTELSPPAKVIKVASFRPGEPASSGYPPVLPPVGQEEDWPDDFGAGPEDDFGIDSRYSGPGQGPPQDDGLSPGEEAEFFGT